MSQCNLTEEEYEQIAERVVNKMLRYDSYFMAKLWQKLDEQARLKILAGIVEDLRALQIMPLDKSGRSE